MTVTYADRSFVQLLLRWRGSLWKAVLAQQFIFLALYFVINASYRYAMTNDQQATFERTVKYFQEWSKVIPLQFLIGFYVSNIFTRWWEQLNNVSFPDRFLLCLTNNIPGTDSESRLIRRTFARHCNLFAVLVWKEICTKIKKRFPTNEHLLTSGLMTKHEYEIFQSTDSTHGRWFVPISWMYNLLRKCYDQGRISDYAHQKLMDELYAYRAGSAMLTVYDWINIPLLYTQVVILATYGYFAFCLVSRQSLKAAANDHQIDLYYPLFTSLEFIFYVGWMKVGEQLRIPFGEDDEDFDMNYVVDRNVHVGNMLIEELHTQNPKLEQDIYWNEKAPVLPHTIASYEVRDRIPNWRLAKYIVKPSETQLHGTSQQLLSRSLRNSDMIAIVREFEIESEKHCTPL